MRKNLIYLSLFLITVLFLTSGCENLKQNSVGREIRGGGPQPEDICCDCRYTIECHRNPNPPPAQECTRSLVCKPESYCCGIYTDAITIPPSASSTD